MINVRLFVAFLGWTVTTFLAHYSVKRALVTLLPLGVEVSPSTLHHLRLLPSASCSPPSSWQLVS